MMPDAFTRKYHPEIALLMDMIISIRKLRGGIEGRPVLLIKENTMPCGKKHKKPPKRK